MALTFGWIKILRSPSINFQIKVRKVDITGRAYFDVAKNESAPFSIKTVDFDVTVLGTSFVVDQNASEVDVISGVVKVSTEKG
jgi:transmembrane sensor